MTAGLAGKLRVVVADDHALVRGGLRALINAQPDMTVAGEASDFAEAARLVATLEPDVLTLDLQMPGGTGLGAIDRLRATPSPPSIVVVSMHDDADYVRAALAAGAAGYVSKSAADAALVDAIRAVHRGRVFVEVGSAVRPEVPRAGADAASGARRLDALSAREREVLIELSRGHTNQAIAERLHLSVKTIESYRARLLAKLGLTTRADLTRFALELGLLDPARAGA